MSRISQSRVASVSSVSSVSTSRRAFLVGASAVAGAALSGCTTAFPSAEIKTARSAPIDPVYRAMYGPVLSEPYAIPAVDLRQVNPVYWRQVVADPTGEGPNVVVVDSGAKFLYWTQPDGSAVRYGIGVGREGFGWDGTATIPRKAQWPVWTPPAEMIARDPSLEPHRDGMAPGLANPLGARALYLYQGGVDTLYRLHGTNESYSIGNNVSSGCVRLMNQDVIDLYNRVPTGSRVVVRPALAI